METTAVPEQVVAASPAAPERPARASVSGGGTASEAALLARLRAGDQAAFSGLVQEHSVQMLHVALLYARSRWVAEEVLQETWLAVLEGIDRFEGRATLKTWIFKILVNTARDRAVREQRVVPFTEVLAHGDEGEQSTTDGLERLRRTASEHHPGHWTLPCQRWARRPEDAALDEELLAHLSGVLARLPHTQRTVLVLRDVQGRSAQEVCARLHLSPGNQRVLLHRARTTVRQGLTPYLAPPPA